MSTPAARTVHAFAPGRTELAGNHTDHQGGRTISAAVDRGIAMELAPAPDGLAHVDSAGYAPFTLHVDRTAPRAEEANSTPALVRGVVALLAQAGVPVGGFSCRVESTIPPGGGLSSSAAFELALVRGLCALFGAPQPDWLAAARLARQVELDWFGKPCGLQDQAVVAHGGVVALDFGTPDGVAASPISFDFEAAGLAVCLVDTGFDHSLANDEFAALVADMHAAAQVCGAQVLGQVPEDVFWQQREGIRALLGDRAVLRAFHYYHEMRLVAAREAALRTGDVAAFLDATRASAASSAQYLQNVSVPGSARQPAMVAAAVVDHALAGQGAFRIHGGGFGGSLQAFVPLPALEGFTRTVEALLGPGRVLRVAPGAQGAWAQ